MTLGTLVLNIGIVAIILTVLTKFVFKREKNIAVSLLQNFCGSLFLFSGWVKAVDPLGTAYKMQDYFKEFESTFTDTWFSFIAPIFPFFSDISVSFSVVVIVFEIVLGLMLLIGAKPKFTAWAFFLLVLFFTVLTGFTFLTGYVQEGGNFFKFSTWGPYAATNMKVTDCGCFGDFIKLEPKVSFLKDVFLLIPAIIFLIASTKMHQLFTKKIRSILTIASLIACFIYCLSNYVWDIPHVDFRPFNKGKNIAQTRIAEDEAQANVQITHWKLKNRENGKIETLASDVYYKGLSSTYNKKDWEVLEQIKTKPSLKPTKISEFEVTDLAYNDLSYTFLESENPAILLVSYKIPADIKKIKAMVNDSIFIQDTIYSDKNEILNIESNLDTVILKEQMTKSYIWEANFSKKLNKLMKELQPTIEKGVPIYYLTGGASPEQLKQLKKDFNLNKVEMCMADDILLKTMVRSNPGIMLWDKGVMKDKWHEKKFDGADLIGQYFD